MASVFYGRLVAVLEAKGMAPAQLSELTGINHSVISRWRNLEGNKIPQAKSLDKVVEATGARVEYLTIGEEPMFKESGIVDLESLALIWDQLPDEAKNKIFRIANTYPLAASAKDHGAGNSEERAYWISQEAAQSIGMEVAHFNDPSAILGDMPRKHPNHIKQYMDGELDEGAFFWLCVKYHAEQKRKEMDQLLKL